MKSTLWFLCIVAALTFNGCKINGCNDGSCSDKNSITNAAPKIDRDKDAEDEFEKNDNYKPWWIVK